MIQKRYTTDSDTGTIELAYTYTIPYTYNYYKVQNMRMYTIKEMKLDDRENTTDLPLFNGLIYTVSASETYKKRVDGQFTSSTNIEEILDGREGVDNTNSKEINEAGSNVIGETITLGTVTFDLVDLGSDTLYDDDDANSKCYSDYISSKVNSISSSITQDNAFAVISASKDGTISVTNNKNEQARVEFSVENDKIQIGQAGYVTEEDVLTKPKVGESKPSSKDTTVIYLKDYKDASKFKVELQTPYPDNVYKQYGFNKTVEHTVKDDFENNSLQIPMNRLNGERVSSAMLYYELQEDIDLNFDVADTSSNHDWTRTSATDNGVMFNDTEMNIDKETNEKATTKITPGVNLPKQLTYSFKSSKTSTNDGTGDVVNVFTPIKYFVRLINNNGSIGGGQTIVDHTTNGSSAPAQAIQKDTRFTITISPSSGHSKYPSISSSKINSYIEEYYIKFTNLHVQDVKLNDELYMNGNSIPSGTWIGPLENIGYSTNISAIAKNDPNVAVGVLNQESNGYVIRGVTKNATQLMLGDLLSDNYDDDLITKEDNNDVAQNKYKYGGFDSQNRLRHTDYYVKNKLYNDNDYVAETDVRLTLNLGRVFDFKVTDVKDLDWKNTFRKRTTNNTNVHSGVVYYSGVNKLNIYTTSFNNMVRRSVDEIGTTAQKTLPVGAFKNTNTTYIYAPKLGYRFSFDFKTTGSIQKDKTAEIDVSFMYIDKNTGEIDDTVDLYYKDTSNKYVKVGSTKDKTNLYFVPNDGYRLTYTEDTFNFRADNLANKAVKLGTLTKLNLNSKMRAISDNSFIQIWYGEYKLPNSTIVVDRNETNLENRKKNGYIAVKFNIVVKEKTSSGYSIDIGYSEDDKSSGQTNTSQWDYEGYMGYTIGRNLDTNPLQLRLEGTIKSIGLDEYQKLKGTVLLYDIDARAAEDYN